MRATENRAMSAHGWQNTNCFKQEITLNLSRRIEYISGGYIPE